MVEHVDVTDPAVEQRREWWREAATMAFYVAVVLGATLVVVDDPAVGALLRLVWGTAIGLAVAHVFAFRLAAVLVERGSPGRHAWELVLAQVAGAVLVPAFVSLVVLVVGGADPAEAARFALAVFIGASAFGIGRGAGAGRVRSIVFAAIVLAVAIGVMVVKYVLSH